MFSLLVFGWIECLSRLQTPTKPLHVHSCIVTAPSFRRRFHLQVEKTLEAQGLTPGAVAEYGDRKWTFFLRNCRPLVPEWERTWTARNAAPSSQAALLCPFAEDAFAARCVFQLLARRTWAMPRRTRWLPPPSYTFFIVARSLPEEAGGAPLCAEYAAGVNTSLGLTMVASGGRLAAHKDATDASARRRFHRSVSLQHKHKRNGCCCLVTEHITTNHVRP